MAEAICAIPLVSAVPPCSRFIQSKPTMQELPFTKLMEVQKRLLPIMEAAGSGTNLALDFKRVEMKISDLNTLVWYHPTVLVSGLITQIGSTVRPREQIQVIGFTLRIRGFCGESQLSSKSHGIKR
jgi:hypothetical protein